MKRGFTLMEVNMAILIMAGGILAMASLFSLGYRENTQSREDVGSAALADAVISPLVTCLSATNVTWSSFKSLGSYPSDNGWGAFLDGNGKVKTSIPSAESVFSSVTGALRYDGTADVNTRYPSSAVSSSKLTPGLLVLHKENSPVVYIAFRAAAHRGQLLSMPIYYTEVFFQGVPDK